MIIKLKKTSQSSSEHVLRKEIERFRERNQIHPGVCCERCLRAHLLRGEMGTWIKEIFVREEVGHNGYYMDEDKVRKIII